MNGSFLSLLHVLFFFLSLYVITHKTDNKNYVESIAVSTIATSVGDNGNMLHRIHLPTEMAKLLVYDVLKLYSMSISLKPC